MSCHTTEHLSREQGLQSPKRLEPAQWQRVRLGRKASELERWRCSRPHSFLAMIGLCNRPSDAQSPSDSAYKVERMLILGSEGPRRRTWSNLRKG